MKIKQDVGDRKYHHGNTLYGLGLEMTYVFETWSSTEK